MDEIYSEKLTKGNRTYFFDIKKSEFGDLYLIISESKYTENRFEHFRIMVFEENMKDFVDVFRKVLIKLKSLKSTNDKAYSVDKIRQTYKQAYQPWTLENDNKLELLFCEGIEVKELALIFERNEGAISSRIKKLELIEKYGSIQSNTLLTDKKTTIEFNLQSFGKD